MMTSFMMSSLVYPAYFMNFKVHILRADPLSIMNLLMEKMETMMVMQSRRVWSGSSFGMIVVLKDKAHGVDRCPTKLRNFIVLMSVGTQDSWSTLSRISPSPIKDWKNHESVFLLVICRTVIEHQHC